MTTFCRRAVVLSITGLMGMAVAPPALRAADSGAPLRIIVPLSAGATGDTVARRLISGLSKELGRPAYVDNLPGAGGVIGTAQLVKAPKDGSTILIVSSNHVDNIGIYRSMPYDPVKDITALAVIGDSPQVLVVNPSLPVHNLSELISLAKAKPGMLHFGSGGNGTTIHIMGAQLAKAAGIDIVHVPYKGNSPMLTGLLGNQVQFAFQATTLVAPYIKAGKLRAIGITSATRSRLLPDVPTLAEQGLKGYDLSIWMMVLGPAGMAPDLVNKINRAVNDTLQEPDVRSWFNSQDWRLAAMTPAAAKTFLETEQVKHLQLVKDAGIKPQ
jgi:tripartite-type tricarboxylate transporter receptor subunit TctC